MRQVLALTTVAGFALAGCYSGPKCPRTPTEQVLSIGCTDAAAPLRLDRGDWLVSEAAEVWKVFEEPLDARGRHIGYLEARDYRQMRGGPSHRMYSVTTVNRRDKVGRIDTLGHAFRFAPRRDAGFEEVDEGVNTLENSVGAIFQTPRPIRLEKTTERRLAFESLDRNRDGRLDAEETAGLGDRLRRADVNRDGFLDFDEFDAMDVL
jgi:hypothetical protein